MGESDDIADTGLRLLAHDTKGLEVISACLQDALTRLEDMQYDPAKRRFALVLNRFMWERQASGKRRRAAGGRRVRCGIHFNSVLSVRTQGIAQDNREGWLSLLAISAEDSEAGSEITLLFAGGGAIRLDAECIDGQLSDMGAAWTTVRRPEHDLEQD